MNCWWVYFCTAADEYVTVTADESCYFRNWTSLFSPSAKEHPNPFLLPFSLTLTPAILVDNIILSSLGSTLVRDLKIKCIFLVITQKTNKAVSLLQITFSCFITSNVLSAGHIISTFSRLVIALWLISWSKGTHRKRECGPLIALSAEINTSSSSSPPSNPCPSFWLWVWGERFLYYEQ